MQFLKSFAISNYNEKKILSQRVKYLWVIGLHGRSSPSASRLSKMSSSDSAGGGGEGFAGGGGESFAGGGGGDFALFLSSSSRDARYVARASSESKSRECVAGGAGGVA